MRTVSGLRPSLALKITAWRGHTGRRYVAHVYGLDEAELPAGVVLAVKRDSKGIAQRVRAFVSPDAVQAAAARRLGADEYHVFPDELLTDDRLSVLNDLYP